MPEEIPYWVTSTHPDHAYKLVLFENSDGGVEEVEMTRDEYIELKRHIAATRGYTSGDAAQRVDELVKEMGVRRGSGLPSPDPQNVAAYLIIAREFYRLCPEATVAPGAEFEETLEQIATGSKEA
jgi:hypothetical protein